MARNVRTSTKAAKLISFGNIVLAQKIAKKLLKLAQPTFLRKYCLPLEQLLCIFKPSHRNVKTKLKAIAFAERMCQPNFKYSRYIQKITIQKKKCSHPMTCTEAK